MDLSIEAIEGDLMRAEQAAGRPTMQLHLTTARIRADLIAAGAGKRAPSPSPSPEPVATFSPDDVDVRIERHPLGSVYIVPDGASMDDRRQVAAELLGVDRDFLTALLALPLNSTVPGEVEPLIVAAEDDDSEVDDDFFAEVRKGRKK